MRDVRPVQLPAGVSQIHEELGLRRFQRAGQDSVPVLAGGPLPEQADLPVRPELRGGGKRNGLRDPLRRAAEDALNVHGGARAGAGAHEAVEGRARAGGPGDIQPAGALPDREQRVGRAGGAAAAAHRENGEPHLQRALGVPIVKISVKIS